MHSRPDMIEPAVEGTPRIEMSPLAEVPLRNEWRELWAVSNRADLHYRHPVSPNAPLHCGLGLAPDFRVDIAVTGLR